MYKPVAGLLVLALTGIMVAACYGSDSPWGNIGGVMYFVTTPRSEIRVGDIETISIAVQFLPDLDVRLCEAVVEGAGVWQGRLIKLGITHVAETLVANFQIRPTANGTVVVRLRMVYLDPGNTIVTYWSDVDPTLVRSLVTQREGVVFGNVSIPIITVRSGPTYSQLAVSLSDLGSAYSSLEGKFTSLQDKSSGQETIMLLLEAGLVISVAANGLLFLRSKGFKTPDSLQLWNKQIGTGTRPMSSRSGRPTVEGSSGRRHAK